MKPYSDKIENNSKIRTFSDDIDENELLWHRDLNDRWVTGLNQNDWFFQLEDELPKQISQNEEFYVPKNVFHRVIKGRTNLIVKIIE